jgi:hypothetical protein
MDLRSLFVALALAVAFDADEPIEAVARAELISAAPDARFDGAGVVLPPSMIDIMVAADAHPVCRLLAQMPLDWAQPSTLSDPKYLASGVGKVHVELLGPGGLARSDVVRLGVYGMLPNSEYGIRTHPAEEVFVMLAGQADWKRGNADFTRSGVRGRSYHPSMMPHATRVGTQGFMSAYAWRGDLSTAQYVYQGLPQT